MTIKEATAEVRLRWRELGDPDRKNGIVCPICGSGSGPNGTGISEDPKRPGSLTCWKCGFKGDILDLLQQTGSTDFMGALRTATAVLGIAPDDNCPHTAATNSKAAVSRAQFSNEKDTSVTVEGYDIWTDALKVPGNAGAAYLQSRGISPATAIKLGVGYASDWRSPKAIAAGKNIPASPRLVFPKASDSYATRDIRSDDIISEQSKKYVKQNQGKGGIFNADVLKDETANPIIVCEGPMDALSAAEAGCSALALCGTSGRQEFVRMLKEKPSNHTFLLALDTDEAGQAAAISLRADLNAMGVPNAICSGIVFGGCKDLNESLRKDRSAFMQNMADAVAAGIKEAQRAQREKAELYRSQRKAGYLILQYDSRALKMDRTPTGFDQLDRLLEGGLYPALYIVGAISSLGKTTFCLQMADQIAASGQDVLVFTMEMSADELIAKSLSRLTYGIDPANALSASSVMMGSAHRLFSKEKRAAYEAAKKQYMDGIGEHLFFCEGIGNIGADQIRERVEEHVRITGERPIVLVDYLQILAPIDIRANDKQNTDRAVFALKTMSRDFGIPVVCVSSFNRENYWQPVSLVSFKESGAIEYSSDILIALQFYGMDLVSGEEETARKARIRKMRETNAELAFRGEQVCIQVKILKNRTGATGSTCFGFRPKYNHFETSKEDECSEEVY